MRFTRFEHTTVFPVEVEALWGFHTRPDVFRLLSPPELRLEILDPEAGISEGSLARFRVASGVFRGSWTALYTAFDERCGFTDVALEAPFPFWEHRHEFEVVGRGRASLRDVIWYSPPASVPHRDGAGAVNEALRSMFAWRHARTLELLARPRPPRPRRARHVSRALVRPGPPWC